MPARTIDTLVTRLREQTTLFGTNVAFVDDIGTAAVSPETSLRAQINLANSRLNLLTKYAHGEYSITLVNDTREYGIDASLDDIYSVWIDPDGPVLIPTSIPDLDERDPLWRATDAASGVHPSEYYRTGLARIGFYPKPSAGGTAVIYGSQDVADMTTTGSTPTLLPEPYHDSLISIATLFIVNIDNLTEDKRAKAALHTQIAAEAITMLRRRTDRMLSRAGASVSFDKLALPPATVDREDLRAFKDFLLPGGGGSAGEARAA